MLTSLGSTDRSIFDMLRKIPTELKVITMERLATASCLSHLSPRDMISAFFDAAALISGGLGELRNRLAQMLVGVGEYSAKPTQMFSPHSKTLSFGH